MLEMMIDWLEVKIETNNRMLAKDRNLSDFELYLMSDNSMMERIKDVLQSIDSKKQEEKHGK